MLFGWFFLVSRCFCLIHSFLFYRYALTLMAFHQLVQAVYNYGYSMLFLAPVEAHSNVFLQSALRKQITR